MLEHQKIKTNIKRQNIQQFEPSNHHHVHQCRSEVGAGTLSLTNSKEIFSSLVENL